MLPPRNSNLRTMNAPDTQIFLTLAVALGLGLLVGLQRQWATDEIAGIRTFPLVTLLGALTALSGGGNAVLVAMGLVCVTILMVVANLVVPDARTAGMTTEVAALVMYMVGSAVAVGYTLPAVVVTGVTTVLLHWKAELHSLVARMGGDELRAAVQLVLIALVVLPVVPNQTYGPFDVLNPYKIWLMVVLIVGISLAAYVVYRVFGGRAGTLLAGVLGGLISSTATTVSYAGRTRANPVESASAAIVVIVASTVVFGRVLVEIGVVNLRFLAVAAPPLLTVMAIMVAIALLAYWRTNREIDGMPEHEPPSDLRAAIAFGLLYGVILFAVAAARESFGQRGLYVVAGLSGLTDVDAITLSVANLVGEDRLEAGQGWRLILFGSLANLVFKAGAVFVLGSSALKKRMAVLFGSSLAAGGLVLMLWP